MKTYITPTLTSDSIGEAAIENNYVYNISDSTFNVTQGIFHTFAMNLPMNELVRRSAILRLVGLSTYTEHAKNGEHQIWSRRGESKDPNQVSGFPISTGGSRRSFSLSSSD
jgi:hypothetical protein